MNGKHSIPLSTYISEAKRDIQERWFKDHKAKVSSFNVPGSDPGVTILDWRKPGTSIFAVRFILCGGTLYVSGDIGEAVYRWGERITIPWIGGLNQDYFMGKCCASEVGRRFEDFDGSVARHRLAEILIDNPDLEESVKEAIEEAMADPNNETLELASRAAYDDGMEAEFAGMISECGAVPSMRGIGHWLGIKMAADQLAAEGGAL